ncbi:MAG TPA: DUF3617 domain-containing protein [Rhizomicrobium sp.]
MQISKWALGGFAALALVATTGSAFADHGKAGLWKITTTSQMSGQKVQSFSSEHCMTVAETKNDTIASQNASCKMTNEKAGGGTFSADMVCNGQVNGSGSLTVTYDSPTHYTGQLTMASKTGSATSHVTNRFEGKWASANCGKVTH